MSTVLLAHVHRALTAAEGVLDLGDYTRQRDYLRAQLAELDSFYLTRLGSLAVVFEVLVVGAIRNDASTEAVVRRVLTALRCAAQGDTTGCANAAADAAECAGSVYVAYGAYGACG